MKKAILFLAGLFVSVSMFAQVGLGVELQIEQDYQFSPTTTDSTNSVTIVVHNTVASEQQITFTGLSEPFYTSDSVLTVAANDSSNFVLSFTPNSSGDFSDVLEFSGNIFGSGALNISGEGVQVSIELGTDTLTLNTVALGSSVSDDIWIYNTGTGTMVVSNITSDDSTVAVSPTSFNIEEGGSTTISVTHTPVLSGNMSATLTVFSNDPIIPIYNVNINGNAISNISGALCGTTLSLINSPYTLTGDITVADSCTLTIEAGVEINGVGHGFYVDGTLNAIGTVTDSIKIIVDELFLRNSTGHDSLNYITANLSSMKIANEEDVYLSNSNIISDELILSGKQGRADFEDCQNPAGWTNNGGVTFSSSYAYNSTCGMRVYALDTDKYATSSFYTANSTVTPISFDFKRQLNEAYGGSYCRTRFYYEINGSNSWSQIYEGTWNGGWEHFSYNINTNIGDSIRIRFTSDVVNTSSNYDQAEVWIDNFYIMNGSSTSNITNCTVNSQITCYQDLDVDNTTLTFNSSEDLLHTYGNVNINNSFLNGNNQCNHGIFSDVDNRDIKLFNSTIKDFTAHGIYTTAAEAEVYLQYSFIKDNAGIGIHTTGTDSHVYLSSSMVTNNGSYGIQSSGQVNLNYSNITFNEDDGIYLTGNNFSNIKNSIIWGNDIVNYTQINTSSGVTSITYSTVQGSGAYGTSGSQYYYGDGSIDDDPVFEDSEQHMSSFSNCVDAGTPWELDANMPFGLGGVRADIGIYGGPDNWFWGGTTVPDGATFISSVEDKPQDQGGNVAVIFDASVWDNSALVNNVTSYAVWRHFDSQGGVIDTVSQGNWELVADMPAQSFDSYAISAETLGDSTILNGDFNTCFVVVAHTDEDDVFWYSNVACGYSTDDIAPLMPDGMEGRYAYTGGLSINWNFPQETDFLESLIYRDGFFVGSTSTNEYFDETAVDGELYLYTVEHIDAAGNASELAAIEVSSLLPNWELASSEKTHHIAIPENFTISVSNDLVDRGDFLGVFYEQDQVLTCGGMVQWSDEDVVLTAFGSTEELEGFAVNEEFVWRFWDASKDEYYHADVSYDSSLPNTANFIEDGLSALQSIDIYAKQEIELPQGWSMISSYVMEDNLLLSSLMAPVNEDIFIMKDDNGTVYWPAYNFNEIGDLSDEKGYKLLMNQSNEISFSGRKVIPNETILNLNDGWQIIPYLRENPASVEALLESVSESIVIVKDDMGNVYWPDWEVNTIGNFMPGKAYQIKMVNDRNYNYPANATVMPLEQRLGDFEPEYFIVQNRTESNMTLGIPVDAWEVSPNVLDEIAVCDAQDRIVGSAVFTGEDLVMSIWANDEYGTSKTGLLERESFHVKYRDMSTNTTYSLKVTAWQQGSSQFQEDEIAIVSWVEQGGIIDQDFHIYPVIPNPSTHVAQLQFFSPGLNEVSIKMFNILGELVLKESLSVGEGIHQFEIPSYLLNNGTYTIKVETTDRVDVQSIQIIR